VNSEVFVTYCMTIFIASMIPGPSSMLALTQGARYGWAAGVFSGLGIVAASVAQGTVAYILIYQIGGLSPAFLEIIKYVGASYIIYLGVTLFKVESFGVGPDIAFRDNKGGQFKCFYDGIAFAIFNPKALTFFAAMFPQFINGGPITIQHLLVIFFPIMIIAFVCFLFYVLAGKLIMNLVGKSKHIGRFFGGAIVLSGVIFLLS
jgi:homoserine/homoserine lactone efflux protein